jgi:hypothetical protein
MSKIYCGIADAYGIDSFFEVEEIGSAPSPVAMRANCNRHRHAVLYWVELSDEKAQTMFEELKKAEQAQDYTKPLLLLKDPDFVENISFEAQFAGSWMQIPNPKLDPYYGGDE